MGFSYSFTTDGTFPTNFTFKFKFMIDFVILIFNIANVMAFCMDPKATSVTHYSFLFTSYNLRHIAHASGLVEISFDSFSIGCERVVSCGAKGVGLKFSIFIF